MDGWKDGRTDVTGPQCISHLRIRKCLKRADKLIQHFVSHSIIAINEVNYNIIDIMKGELCY